MFHCGDSVDMHGAHDQGKFILFRHHPLAAKNGSYTGYGSPQHSYYRSPWSGNCIVFDDGKNSGRQPSYTAQGGRVNSFAEFLAGRQRPPVGNWSSPRRTTGSPRRRQSRRRHARQGRAVQMDRELVFLGYQHLIVLDRVKCAPGVNARSVLNLTKEPSVDGARVRVDVPPGRLFVQALLPDVPKIVKVGGPTATTEMKMGNDWRIEITGPDPKAAEQVYLSVLTATDDTVSAAPKVALTRDGREDDRERGRDDAHV